MLQLFCHVRKKSGRRPCFVVRGEDGQALARFQIPPPFTLFTHHQKKRVKALHRKEERRAPAGLSNLSHLSSPPSRRFRIFCLHPPLQREKISPLRKQKKTTPDPEHHVRGTTEIVRRKDFFLLLARRGQKISHLSTIPMV